MCRREAIGASAGLAVDGLFWIEARPPGSTGLNRGCHAGFDLGQESLNLDVAFDAGHQARRLGLRGRVLQMMQRAAIGDRR